MTHSSTMKTWKAAHTHTQTRVHERRHTPTLSYATCVHSYQNHTAFFSFFFLTNAIHSAIKFLVRFLPRSKQAETHTHLHTHKQTPSSLSLCMPAGCDCTCLFQQISISNCPLFLPCAVLPHCSVSFIFPTSLVESASLFSFPSFLRPFPHNIISLKP